jgi:SAM-dependent methyltransferase
MADLPSLHPAVALVAVAESFIEGRRVLVCGDALTELPDRLLERGARLVHMCDPDTSRVAEAATRNTSRNVSFSPLGDGGLAVREGAFDFLLVANVALLESPAHALRRLRRALGPRGVAVIACPNAERKARLCPDLVPEGTPDYYAFYDLVAAEFEQVRMFGQAPFVAYAVADFSPEGEVEPAIDTGFLPGGTEEPEWFIAVAAQYELSLDPFTVVQLPFELTLRGLDGSKARGALEQRVRTAEAAERAARERMAALEAEREKRAGGKAELQARVPEEVARLRQELARRDQWLRGLEERATAADARADQAEEELDDLRASLEQKAKQIGELERAKSALPTEAELQAQHAVLRERDALRAERNALEAERDALLATRDQLRREREGHRLELESLEAAIERTTRERDALLSERDELRERALTAIDAQAAEAKRAAEQAFTLRAAALEADRAAAAALADERAAALTAAEERHRRELEAALAELAPLRDGGRQREALEEEAVQDLARLEAQLAERGTHVRELEARLRESARVGRTLVRRLAALENLSPAPALPNAAPAHSDADAANAPREVPSAATHAGTHAARVPPSADALAQLARAEADVAALSWTADLLAVELARETGTDALETLARAQAAAALTRAAAAGAATQPGATPVEETGASERLTRQ